MRQCLASPSSPVQSCKTLEPLGWPRRADLSSSKVQPRGQINFSKIFTIIGSFTPIREVWMIILSFVKPLSKYTSSAVVLILSIKGFNSSPLLALVLNRVCLRLKTKLSFHCIRKLYKGGSITKSPSIKTRDPSSIQFPEQFLTIPLRPFLRSPLLICPKLKIADIDSPHWDRQL